MSAGCQEQSPVNPSGEPEMQTADINGITLISDAFAQGQPIPQRHTCDGEDLSPPLSWEGLPTETQSVVLICDDPDAPMGTWVHWILCNLPPETTSLPEGVPAVSQLPNGAVQGITDFGRPGYGGPCPPRGGPHRYFFRIAALDTVLSLEPGPTRDDVEHAMEGHVLAQGSLMGTYERQ
jgi:Raf kinase inhibitor-like YbhB/YbcL family protein